MKTSKRTIVLMTVELSEVDLDIAIDNYPRLKDKFWITFEKKRVFSPRIQGMWVYL